MTNELMVQLSNYSMHTGFKHILVFSKVHSKNFKICAKFVPSLFGL